jgi:hypothetical protein
MSFPCGLDSHAAFLAHDVALLVKLTVDRKTETRGLQQEPQLHAVGGQAVEVVGRVLPRTGVEPHAAALLDDSGEGLRVDEAVGLLDSGLKLRLQGLDLRGIGANSEVPLSVELVVDRLNGVESLLLLRVVLCADRRSTLEGHVLEHMGETGLTAGIVHRGAVDVSVKGDNRRLVPFEHNEMQPVGKREFSDLLLVVLEALRGEQTRRQKPEKNSSKCSFHGMEPVQERTAEQPLFIP